MTIHGDHPFIPPESERDPVRRLRGRLGGAVSLWTTGEGSGRVGLTVSSLLLAPGEPAHVLGLIDPDSALADALDAEQVVVVQLLTWSHRQLADAFAGQFPAPGGPFRLGEKHGGWVDTDWGPLLTSSASWLGARLVDTGSSADDEAGRASREVGWVRLYDCVVEHIQVGGDDEPLEHRRGRYLRP